MARVELWSSGPGWFGFGSASKEGETELNISNLKAGDRVVVNGRSYIVSVNFFPDPGKVSLWLE